MNLDWGNVTPEGVKVEKNEFFYVYNHDVSDHDKIWRTIRFAIGKLNYYDHHLPPNPTHKIFFDIRGQKISEETCAQIEALILENYKGKNQVSVSFKTQ